MFSSCYSEYTDEPVPPPFSSAQEEVLYYAEKQFPRSPVTTLHFSAPAAGASESDPVPLQSFLRSCTDSDALHVLFELVYSLAGMYSVMGLQLHCFKSPDDLSTLLVHRPSASPSRIYAMIAPKGRKDWQLPHDAPFLEIKVGFDAATWWRPLAPAANKKFTQATLSGGDLCDILCALLQKADDPAALDDAARTAHSPLGDVLALASECFPKHMATRFGLPALASAADLSITDCLMSRVFAPLQQTFASTTELPACIWKSR
jgi:hypothetical protein